MKLLAVLLFDRSCLLICGYFHQAGMVYTATRLVHTPQSRSIGSPENLKLLHRRCEYYKMSHCDHTKKSFVATPTIDSSLCFVDTRTL